MANSTANAQTKSHSADSRNETEPNGTTNPENGPRSPIKTLSTLLNTASIFLWNLNLKKKNGSSFIAFKRSKSGNPTGSATTLQCY